MIDDLASNSFPSAFELSRNDELPDLDDEWSSAATPNLNNTIATEGIRHKMPNQPAATHAQSLSPCDGENKSTGTERYKRKYRDNYNNINNKEHTGRLKYLISCK